MNNEQRLSIYFRNYKYSSIVLQSVLDMRPLRFIYLATFLFSPFFQDEKTHRINEFLIANEYIYLMNLIFRYSELRIQKYKTFYNLCDQKD